MQLARVNRQSDPLGRYYTDAFIGAALVGAMQPKAPKTVLDLGAGAGSLSAEAVKVWTQANFVTVDIDRKAKCAQLFKTHGPAFNHYVGDALDFSLAELIGLGWAQADAAICNPPYLRPKWKKHFLHILEEAGLSSILPRITEVSSDVLFVAQNLRMLKNEGKLGLILPDGIIAGEKYAKFRRTLLERHSVEKVIELPRLAFKNTDARAHIVVISKNARPGDFVPVQQLDEDGKLSNPINVPTCESHKRLDYSFLLGRSKNFRSASIADVTDFISRGSYSSVSRKEVDFPVFHTTDYHSESVPSKFYLSKRQISRCSGVMATRGDILIARVGRNLSSKACLVSRDGYVAISDCIWLLRVESKFRDKIFRFLRSEDGRAALESVTQGVGARFITSRSLRELCY